MKPLRVCFILEGSYPYITGGVSSWVHDLIRGMPEIEFSLFSISPDETQTLKYDLPENVVEHKDIVLSRLQKSVKKMEHPRKTLRLIKDMHDVFNNNAVPEMGNILENMPEGYYAYEDAVKSSIGWKMIEEFNRRNNPVYAFSDYFWAWKSSHNMIFTILGSVPPEADIYHSVSTGYAGLAAVAAKIRLKKPFLLTEHGLYHKEREMELRKASFLRGYQRDMWIKVYNSLSRVSYHYSDISTSLFEYNRRIQLSLGAKPENAVVIPNGIDVERFSSVVRENRTGFHVGLVGRVVPIKDIKTFITLSKIVHDHIKEARFYCIGPTDEDPGYYEDCVRMVESFNLTDVFEFTGRRNVLEYYSFLDVLLLTSVREAQPLVILEAFAAGVPVVSTRVGNVPEMLEYDERFLSSSKDAERLSRNVLYIHAHPDEMRVEIEKNREKVNRLYNKNDLYDKYRALYRELITK